MTREEAVHQLQFILDVANHDDCNSKEIDALDEEAINMEIKALEKEPTEFEEVDFVQEHKKIPVTLDLTPCDDAISRILKRMWNCRGKHTTSIDKVKMEQIIRDELPSITQMAGWIPVSERSPEESDEYLVSVIDGSGEDNDYEAVGVAWFAHKKDYDIKESEWRQLGIDETVIAWMPKPAPYMAESEEGK